jgi:hypothetical protein
MAALDFSFDTLKTGGHFLCKYYQGSEEKAFETKLKRLFAKVNREKPDSSRNVCNQPFPNSICSLSLGIEGGVFCGTAPQGDTDEGRSLPGMIGVYTTRSTLAPPALCRSVVLVM